MSTHKVRRVPIDPKFELERIIPLEQVEELSSLSRESLRRHYPERIIELSPRRYGMRLKHALMLSEDKTAA